VVSTILCDKIERVADSNILKGDWVGPQQTFDIIIKSPKNRPFSAIRMPFLGLK